MFKHPKYYKELRKRNKSDQSISSSPDGNQVERSTGPGLKLQAPSSRFMAMISTRKEFLITTMDNHQ